MKTAEHGMTCQRDVSGKEVDRALYIHTFFRRYTAWVGQLVMSQQPLHRKSPRILCGCLGFPKSKPGKATSAPSAGNHWYNLPSRAKMGGFVCLRGSFSVLPPF